jgi:PAS domain S-box-containing protein
MNPAGLRMVGAPSIDAVRGCDVLDLVAPECRAAYVDRVAAVFRGETTTLVFEIIGLDGRRKWMEQYAAPMWDPDQPGRVEQLLAVTRDITGRIHVEASLRASEAQLNEAQRIAKLGSWEVDHATGQQRWSDEVFRIFGLEPGSVTPDQSVAKNSVHPDDRATVERAFVESMRDGRPFHLTHRLLLPDGRVTHVEAHGYTDVGPDGRPLHTRATLQDVTERVIAEAAIRTSLREKEVLLREIHHRVKNNMQTVSSLLQFHAGKVEGPHAAGVFADIHQRLRAMTLVHEKLYGSKDLSEVDFADYVESLVADVVRPDGRGASVSCATATVPLRLPVGLALPAGMALVELLTNVYKHAFDGRSHGHAWVHVACADGQVSVSVADDGVGMPQGFEPHDTNSFGWSLVRSLAQQLNGTYAIEPRPGPGTRVTLSFPRGPAAA